MSAHRCPVVLPPDTKAAHCTACCTTFTTPGNFDRHRRGEGDARACLGPASAGLVQVQRAGYVAWSMPGRDREEEK